MEEKEKEIQIRVLEAQQGNEASFEVLFNVFFDPITRYVSKKVNNENVEDIVGEIFLKIIENLQKYKQTSEARFSSWIFRIARNTIIDFYRKKQLQIVSTTPDEEQEFQILDESPTPDITTNQTLNNEKINQFLKDLPEKQKEIIELKYQEGFSNEEIANITGYSEGNIRIIHMRAIKTLKEEWDKKTQKRKKK